VQDDTLADSPMVTEPGAAPPSGPFSAALRNIRNRVAGGLIICLPIAITFWVFYWLYTTLRRAILDPIAGLYQMLLGRETLRVLPPWWERFLAPLLAILLVGVMLYVFGYFARTRVFRIVDWSLRRVPIVTMVYKAVSDLMRSLESQHHARNHQRVVLVPFPHPGSRALGLVTKTLRDEQTGRTIVCVCVMTGVVPPAGFTLFLPEEDVLDVDWTVNQMLQAIVSGGITAPDVIAYHAPTSSKGASG
jgi:uncharacterized membrane protein